MTRTIPRHTLDGVRGAEVTVHPFTTDDGLGLSLLRVRRHRAAAALPGPGAGQTPVTGQAAGAGPVGGDGAPTGDVVLVHHGLTASSDMFIMPEHANFVNALLDAGFHEVWVCDTRMSNRFPYVLSGHRHTLDDVAYHDHPAALRTVRAAVGDRPIHVVAHCLGSVSFLMSLAAGWVDGVASVVSNSVALVPRVSTWSRIKLTVGPDLAEYGLGLQYLDPNAARGPRLTRGWLLSKAASLFHRECDEPACHMVSFLWGTGWPTMYSHDTLDPVTHARIGDLLGGVGVHYHRHVRTMVEAGRAVPYRQVADRDLPADYLARYVDRIAEIDTPVLFLTGSRNNTFHDSNILCFQHLEAARPGGHELRILPGYGHIDPFIGRDAARDVFPTVIDFLDRHRRTGTGPAPHQVAS